MYGSSFGLRNSAAFVANYLNEQGIPSKVVLVVDSNDIDREVTQYNPSHVIIEALWVPPAKFIELFAIPRHQSRKWIVRIHSLPGFLANEGIAFRWLNEYGNIDFDNFMIAPNTAEFTNDLEDVLGLYTIYLPNIYQPLRKHVFHDFKKEIQKDIDGHEYINIGCFGAIRPLKNHLTQAIAAIEFAEGMDKKVKFHINSTRIEQKGESVYQNLQSLFYGSNGHKLICHHWMNHHDFLRILKSMDIGMQVSFTESFNIVTADYVYCDVPVVVSPAVTWLSSIYQADPNSTRDIIDKLRMSRFLAKIGLQKFNKCSLKRYNRHAKEIWLDFLKI
jgi:hypothetical protein